jgi:hypothetical protein
MNEPWDDLTDELTRTTIATYARAAAWVVLGRDLGWTVEETRERVSTFITDGMHPRDIRRAMEVKP